MRGRAKEAERASSLMALVFLLSFAASPRMSRLPADVLLASAVAFGFLGAYTTFVVQEIIRAHHPWLFDYSLAIAIPLAFLVFFMKRSVAGKGEHIGAE